MSKPMKLCPNCKGTGRGLRTVFDTYQRCLLCGGKGKMPLKFAPPSTDDTKQGYWLMHAQLIRGHKPAVLSDAEKKYWATELNTVSIMLESNSAVRTAMIYCYGVERFLKEGRSVCLNSQDGYDLISIQLPEDEIVALKMVCPSTKILYFIPVPPDMHTVPEALDWYFQIKDYLGRVGAQT